MTLPRRLYKAAVSLVLATLLGLTASGTGCSAQGEGERCTHFASMGPDAGDYNGNGECQSGLICWAAFNTDLYPFDRCCPPDLMMATNVPACQGTTVGTAPEASVGEGGGESSTPVDGSMKDGRAKDAKTDVEPAEAGTEAGGETGADATPSEAGGG